ncbi:MAG: hypothetical protein ACFFBE_02760 [Promethearchaeota archaeon]
MRLNISNNTLKFIMLSGLIGPILFFAVLTTLGIMWEGYDPISTGMSEIGAVDSPFKVMMNYLGFSLLGIFIIIFSIGFKVFSKKISNLQLYLFY